MAQHLFLRLFVVDVLKKNVMVMGNYCLHSQNNKKAEETNYELLQRFIKQTKLIFDCFYTELIEVLPDRGCWLHTEC